MKDYYIGIDPGQEGGIVVLDSNGTVIEVFKTPDTRREFQERVGVYKDKNCMCILEKINCRPTNGAKANFTLGINVERLLYTLEVCKIPHQEITPQSWMKAYMMKKDKGEAQNKWKNRLKNRAMQLFPNSKVTLWSADAFLIAEHARRFFK